MIVFGHAFCKLAEVVFELFFITEHFQPLRDGSYCIIFSKSFQSGLPESYGKMNQECARSVSISYFINQQLLSPHILLRQPSN